MDNLSTEATALIVIVTTVLSQFVKPLLSTALQRRGDDTETKSGSGNVTVQVNSDGNTQTSGVSPGTPNAQPGGYGGSHSGLLGSTELLELLLTRSSESREAAKAEKELRDRYLSLVESQEDRLNDQATTIERLICYLERVESGGTDDDGGGE